MVAARENVAVASADMDDFDFEPVQVTVDAILPPAQRWSVHFKAHAELYAKGNEAGLLLRELGRLGQMTVRLDSSLVPDLAELDPEGAYLTWSATLQSDCGEAAIRDVFDFVEDECDLVIQLETDVPDVLAAAGSEEVPEVDVMALIGKAQASIAQDAIATPATATPAPSQPVEAAPPPPPPRPIMVPVVDVQQAPKPAPEQAGEAAIGATIRVDLDRVDR